MTTILIKLHDSASRVTFAKPSNFIRSSPCSERDGTKVCSSTSLQSHSSSFQFIGKTVSVCVEDKTTHSAEYFWHKEIDFGIEVFRLCQTCAFGNYRVRSTPSKRELTPIVACVEEDRVRLARSHCVRRHFCARGVLHVKCEPIVHGPTVSNGISVSQSARCCSLNVNIFPAAIDQTLSRNPVVENAQHEPHCSRFFTGVSVPFAVQSTISHS